ncbi:rhamnosyltransferase [Paenibacillus sp. GP183]|nr:rhamnosyltransferase [Paenibacillus sp. GP183]
MLLSGKINVKRLGIFFFYDEQGIVDDYITILLDDMKKNVSDLLVVCNGKLTPEGRVKLNKSTNNIFVRDNVGFDVWAYKQGMELYGWEKLADFDEVILFNFTIFGPFFPFKDMFDEMDKRDVDFWGITKYHKYEKGDPFGTIKYKYIPEHIQSHFIAIRKNMLSSYEFKFYWENMPEIKSYEGAIGYHEAIFTKDFNDKGYSWDVYINTDDLVKHVYHPLLMMPLEMVKNRKCPILKRRSFFHHIADFLNNSTGEQSVEIYNYLVNQSLYDFNLIWDNILRTCNQTDIKRALHHNYVLSTSSSDIKDKLPIKRNKIALIMHIYFEDLIEYCLNYARAMPPETDVYITTNSEQKKLLIERAFEDMECAKIEVRLVPNRGRDISALLVACKDFILDYDYVCFAHDKKTNQLDPHIKGESFSYKCFENILKNRVFVENIINTFEENPRLGMLSPPPPYHGEFYMTIGLEWTINFEITRDLARKLKLDVDINSYKEPIAPLGTMFWFRPKALKTLILYDWKFDDFPKEPNKTDGTILHAIERIYPYVAQHEGYYPAWVLSDSFAKIEITNLYYMLREINVQYFNKYGPTYHYHMVQNLQSNFLLDVSWKDQIKVKLKKYLPRPVINSLKYLRKLYKKR